MVPPPATGVSLKSHQRQAEIHRRHVQGFGKFQFAEAQFLKDLQGIPVVVLNFPSEHVETEPQRTPQPVGPYGSGNRTGDTMPAPPIAALHKKISAVHTSSFSPDSPISHPQV
jgi:hypothetical protein